MDFELETDVADGRTNTGYVSGNIREEKNHTLTNDKKGDTYKATGYVPTDYEYLVNTPLFESYADIHTAKEALKIVTSTAGATMPVRDEQHLRVIRETLSGTHTYNGSKSGIRGEIDTEADLTGVENSGWEVWAEETRGADFDTDQDGMPDWYETLVGSDPNTGNQNDDPNHDGWTLLEDYLEFMAHPYIIVEPGTTGSIDVKPFFAGFYGQNTKYNTLTPTYTVATKSSLFTPSVEGSIVKAVAGQNGGVDYLEVTVNDGETTYTQPIGIAVTGNPAAIHTVWSEDGIDVAKREFFTLDGKQVTKMTSREVYLMKVTDTKGGVHTVKIIKN